ncbi:MAG: hypothetical protein ACLR4Z_12825 [Butyricicoccaceae bacterium]
MQATCATWLPRLTLKEAVPSSRRWCDGGLAADGYRRAGKRSAVFVGDDELNRLEDLAGHLDRAAGGDARGLRDGRGEALVRRRQRVAAALDVNGRLAVRVGDEGLCSGAAFGIIRGEE